jgi:hypothetical protein
MKKNTNKAWLLIIHQIPPKPDYFRVKIWRRLQQVGAVAIKQSVYVLPNSEACNEDFIWILKEINNGGGDANLSEATFLEGITDDQIVALFQDARQSDYEKLVQETDNLKKDLEESAAGMNLKIKSRLGKLKKRLNDIVAIDFFEASQRIAAENAVADLSAKLKGSGKTPQQLKIMKDLTGKTWVTRKNIYADRMASAWLITRFIDKNATFKFVETKKYALQKNEVRFDMFEAEFTHEGDMCTFEVLIRQFKIKNKALQAVSEIIHDIDLKDGKFARKEALGLSIMLSGINAAYGTDDERLRASSEAFDNFYIFFNRNKKKLL